MTPMHPLAGTFGSASLTIILLLLAAFLAGMLSCQLLRLLGICCRPRRAVNTETVYMSVEPEITEGGPETGPETAPRMYTRSIYSETPASRPRTKSAPPSGPRIELRKPAPLVEAESSAGRSSFESRVQEMTGGNTPVAPNFRTELEIRDDGQEDDLTRLEGIGPNTSRLLNEAGIRNYARLATMSRDELRHILETGGPQFRVQDPKSWPYQAELAARNNWDRLREYQEFLLSGKTR
ncbi:MAG: hypothetical protein KDI44_15125 [Thiothrix sp.]|nr:hypothetical protein [Thiothrix sp.]